MRWADYSGGRPSGAALAAAGFGGALRYVGLGGGPSLPGKRLTAAEYRDLTGAGLQVLLVCEGSTSDAWDGYNAGVANAQTALADARSLGVPDWVGIAAAADAHAQFPSGAIDQAKVSAAVEYARGFRDVLGSRAGFYGFQETVSAVHAAGLASWYWRCGSAPSPAEQAWTTFWQRNAAPTITVVEGVVCDINEQYLPVGEDEDMTPEQWAFVRNALIFAEQCNRTLVNQMTGEPHGEPSYDANMNWRDGFLPGFPSLVDKTPHTTADYARLADLHSFNTEANGQKLLDAVAGLSTGNVDVDALAAALQSALAPEIVKVLGQKLTA